MAYQQNPDEIGALWLKTGRKGKFLSGTVNGQDVLVFKNEHKRSEKAPDYRVLKARPRNAAPEPEMPYEDEEAF